MDSLVDHILLLSNIIVIVFLNVKHEGFFYLPLSFLPNFVILKNLVIFSKNLAQLVEFTLGKQEFPPKKCQKKWQFFFKHKKHWL